MNQEQTPNISLERHLSFSLGQEEYGIPLLKVREVIAMPEVTTVPQTPAYFLGIMNLRGQVISVIDLRQKLGIKPATTERAVIICDLGGASIGVVVDSVNQVLSPTAEGISPPPELAGAKKVDYITAVWRSERRLILFLNIGSVLDVQDHQLINRVSGQAA